MILPTVRLIDLFLRSCRRVLSEPAVRRLDRSAANLGGFAVYSLLAVLMILLGLIAIRTNDLYLFLLALGIAPAGIVLHYIALKMLGSVDRLISASRTELTSSGFLDVIALVNVLAAIFAPLAGLFAAVGSGQVMPLLSGLFVMALCSYTATVALNPTMINVYIARSASIGQEAVGIITFAMKGLYRFTPIGFAVLMVLATVEALVLLGLALVNTQPMSEILADAFWLLSFSSGAMLLPLASYVLFVLLYLVIDLYRSIFLIAQVASFYRRQGQVPDAPPGGPPLPTPPSADSGRAAMPRSPR